MLMITVIGQKGNHKVQRVFLHMYYHDHDTATTMGRRKYNIITKRKNQLKWNKFMNIVDHANRERFMHFGVDA